MAKKSVVEREKKRRILSKKYYFLRISLKNKIKEAGSLEQKLFYHSLLQKLPRNSSLSRLHNRCFVTGRARGYYRIFGLSRHVLRDMSHYGLLPGVTKSSW
uniref:Small ribosomal subunit protein uS14c n=1 Tax=Euglena viridis TaxID=3040 RepID=M1EVB5_EUGVI|nr:ribosomal protein S14 [Euglena viridis]AEY70815.1 ribosomal protein S14 [Euglena viridis]